VVQPLTKKRFQVGDCRHKLSYDPRGPKIFPLHYCSSFLLLACTRAKMAKLLLRCSACPQVNEYLAAQGKETHSAAVIQSNPDQSKHLETARMKVNSLWIDLVNLRSETYADSSRIPTMEFGTPLQDAERRWVVSAQQRRTLTFLGACSCQHTVVNRLSVWCSSLSPVGVF